MSTPRPEQPVPPPNDPASQAPAEEPVARDGAAAADARPDGADEVDESPALQAEDPRPVVRAMDVAHPSRVRRAPRYGRFAFLGLVLGALLALVLSLVGVSDYSTRDVFLVLFIGLGTVGVFAGLVVALISDRRSGRRAD